MNCWIKLSLITLQIIYKTVVAMLWKFHKDDTLYTHFTKHSLNKELVAEMYFANNDSTIATYVFYDLYDVPILYKMTITQQTS